MFGVFEKINFRALPEYLGNALNTFNVFIFSQDGQSGFKVKVQDFFAGVQQNLSSVWKAISQLKSAIAGARQAYVFDNTAQIEAWIANPAIRPDVPIPSEMPIGSLLLTRAQGDQHYWWDGSATQLYDNSQIVLDNYINKDLDVTQNMLNPTPASPDKIPSQLAIWNWAKRIIANWRWNASNNSYEVWADNDTTGIDPNARLMKLGTTESFFGRWRAFRVTETLRSIQFAVADAMTSTRNAIEIYTNGWRLNDINGKRLIELLTNGRFVIRRPSQENLEVENQFGIKVAAVKEDGNLGFYDSTEYEYLRANVDGTVQLTPKVLSSNVTQFYCRNYSGFIGLRSISDFATAAQLAALKLQVQGGQTTLVFDNTAQVDAWIDEQYQRPDGISINEAETGWLLYTRDGSNENWWWDADNRTKQPLEANLIMPNVLLKSDLLGEPSPTTDTTLTGKAIIDLFNTLQTNVTGGTLPPIDEVIGEGNEQVDTPVSIATGTNNANGSQPSNNTQMMNNFALLYEEIGAEIINNNNGFSYSSTTSGRPPHITNSRAFNMNSNTSFDIVTSGAIKELKIYGDTSGQRTIDLRLDGVSLPNFPLLLPSSSSTANGYSIDLTSGTPVSTLSGIRGFSIIVGDIGEGVLTVANVAGSSILLHDIAFVNTAGATAELPDATTKPAGYRVLLFKNGTTVTYQNDGANWVAQPDVNGNDVRTRLGIKYKKIDNLWEREHYLTEQEVLDMIPVSQDLSVLIPKNDFQNTGSGTYDTLVSRLDSFGNSAGTSRNISSRVVYYDAAGNKTMALNSLLVPPVDTARDGFMTPAMLAMLQDNNNIITSLQTTISQMQSVISDLQTKVTNLEKM